MSPPELDLTRMRARFAQCQEAASRQGITLREPPPEPTTCCGRGCNGCVWEGFYAAAQYWHEEAQLQLAPEAPSPPALKSL